MYISICQVLCQALKVKRVVFVSDVNGVYDKPPNTPGVYCLLTLIQGLIFGRIAKQFRLMD